MTILTLADYYLPGFRAGGPIRTLQAMVRKLSGEFTFKIVTNRHDWGDPRPYAGVATGCWHPVEAAGVCYLDSGIRGELQLLHVLRNESYDVLYLNSLFSRRFSLLPLLWRRCGLLPNRPVILAPRGECSPGALRIKRGRKRAVLRAAKSFGLYDGIWWQASASLEREEIIRAMGTSPGLLPSTVFVAPDLSLLNGDEGAPGTCVAKRSGAARIVFLSRVSPKKNLEGALAMLSGVTGQVQFDIFGPADDPAYWASCQRAITRLPANIQVNCLGPVNADEVLPTLRKYDLLLLPTLGENFGHVILESLSAGCPVLISDQTPWQNLESSGAGWSFPLDRHDLFRAAIQSVIDADGPAQSASSQRALQYAQHYLGNGTDVATNREMFRSLCGAANGVRRAA